MSGIVTGIRPRVQAAISIKSLGLTSKPIWFVVDTGSSFSAVSEADATLIGIDCSSLPLAKKRAIGFGGFFKPRMVDKQVELIFIADGKEYRVPRSGFVVICPPDNIDAKTKQEITELTPSVLGMDVLSKFDIHVYKKRVELDLREA